ncbi:MAG TPA: MFS transporter [Candidatus Paceibacterota bacterium]|nr:MFS transporter [Candidatus Paceibacterota bacterium]
MKPLRPIFIASFLYSFHLALLMYLNSTVLNLNGNSLETTLAYTLGSMLAIALLVASPRLVRRYGNSRFLMGGLIATIIVLWAMGILITTHSFVLLFIVYFSLYLIVWYGFDLLFEHSSRRRSIGNIRGLVLTLDNTGVMLAPVVATAMLGMVGFAGVYFFGALAVIASYLTIRNTPRVAAVDASSHGSMREAFRALLAHRSARRIVALYFILQFFYAWMVVYTPLYLLSLGFSWKTIGIMFSIMLSAFVLLQYGVGILADRLHAERAIIMAGCWIAAGATLALALPLPPDAIIFTAILFATRIGASILEVGCESAFFKQVKESDLALIGTLRMTMPMAYIIAPLCGALVLYIGSPRLLFGILAGILALGGLYARRLTGFHKSAPFAQ